MLPQPSTSIEVVAFDSPAAQAIVNAAVDELDRRYGPMSDRAPLDPATFEHPRGAFLIARIEGHLAGGVGLRTIDTSTVEIKRLWVRPDLRRTGVGRALMAAAEDGAQQLGAGLIVLETGPLQPDAVALYEAEGWQRVDELPVAVEGHPEAIRFLKRFSAEGRRRDRRD